MAIFQEDFLQDIVSVHWRTGPKPPKPPKGGAWFSLQWGGVPGLIVTMPLTSSVTDYTLPGSAQAPSPPSGYQAFPHHITAADLTTTTTFAGNKILNRFGVYFGGPDGTAITTDFLQFDKAKLTTPFRLRFTSGGSGGSGLSISLYKAAKIIPGADAFSLVPDAGAFIFMGGSFPAIADFNFDMVNLTVTQI